MLSGTTIAAAAALGTTSAAKFLLGAPSWSSLE
jgi:hypothetical protein